MNIQLEDCNLSQTILEFAQENTSTGKISLKLYGSHADNWINGKERLPYIKKDGKIHWNVPIKEVTLYNLAQTFLMNIGNNNTIEFDEVQNWGSFEEDITKLNIAFCSYLKQSIKGWRPNAHVIKAKELIKYIKSTRVYPVFVLNAIWIRNSYSASEFACLFDVTNRQAEKILEAAGYQRKIHDPYYNLISQRKDSIKSCLEKSDKACNILDDKIRITTRWKSAIYKRFIRIGEFISDFGKRKDFFYKVTSDWSEPAYSKRKDLSEKVLSSIMVLAMVFFIIALILVFTLQMINRSDKYSDSLYSFWGAIAGAMIAGLVTIFTTYLIIRRSYKIDYHQERMAALPFFELNIVAAHFSTLNSADIPENVQKIMKNSTYFSTCLLADAMLIEIKNVGNGPAFQVVLEGLTPFYEEPSFQSIVIGKHKYAIVYNRQQIKCKLIFYDIYGNYYYQTFSSEYNDNKEHIDINTNPPELILRTSRVRYIQ